MISHSKMIDFQSLATYTANIDKMMNSDSIFIKFFKMKAPNFNITQLLRHQTDTPKARKHAWKGRFRKVREEFWMLYLINISSSTSPEDASYIYKVLEDKVFDLLLISIFSSVNLNVLISGLI
jgi:hypothetical protein